MSRDHRKLRVFVKADSLVPAIYRLTRSFPVEERFGLQSQLRRAAVSAACNIVEGSARRTTREYLNFLNIATGSAAEVEYLIPLAVRLNLAQPRDAELIARGYSELSSALRAMIRALEPRLSSPEA
jgi:four helix bundle protein